MLCCRDVAMTKKQLTKSAERRTKCCNSNDEETGDYAVQRLIILSRTSRAKNFYSTNFHLRRMVYAAYRKLASHLPPPHSHF